MRVLFIEHKEVLGGGQVFMLNLSLALRKMGCDVRIVCSPKSPILQKFFFHGIQSYPVGLGKIQKSSHPLILLQNFLWRLIPTLRLLRILKTFRPDVAICNGTYSFIASFLALKVAGQPFLWVVHNTSLPAGRVLTFLIKQSQKIAVVSQEIQHQFIELVPPAADRIVHINNGIDLSRLPKLADLKNQENTGQKKNILFLGRLSVEKGADVLLEAIRHLAERRKDFLLRIAGDGPEKSALQSRAQDYGISSCVVFLDHVSLVAPLLAESDIFVLPSRSEANPLALLEAICSGLPVVATAVGEVKELAKKYQIMITPVEDAIAFATALNELFNNLSAAKKNAQALMSQARKAFSGEKMAKEYHALLKGIVRKKADHFV